MKEKPCQCFLLSHIHSISKHYSLKSSGTVGLLENIYSPIGMASCPHGDQLLSQQVTKRVGWAVSNSHMAQEDQSTTVKQLKKLL